MGNFDIESFKKIMECLSSLIQIGIILSIVFSGVLKIKGESITTVFNLLVYFIITVVNVYAFGFSIIKVKYKGFYTFIASFVLVAIFVLFLEIKESKKLNIRNFREWWQNKIKIYKLKEEKYNIVHLATHNKLYKYIFNIDIYSTVVLEYILPVILLTNAVTLFVFAVCKKTLWLSIFSIIVSIISLVILKLDLFETVLFFKFDKEKKDVCDEIKELLKEAIRTKQKIKSLTYFITTEPLKEIFSSTNGGNREDELWTKMIHLPHIYLSSDASVCEIKDLMKSYFESNIQDHTKYVNLSNELSKYRKNKKSIEKIDDTLIVTIVKALKLNEMFS